MEVQKFEDYKLINEEFIAGVIKGALGKLINVFNVPFKDISNDFKNLFSDDDPNSIKSVIITNINQAIDGAQKEILKIKDESSIIGIIDNMVYSLIELSNNIGKDIELAFNKEKSTSIKEIAQAVLLGNKKADWVGIVGLLDPQKSVVKKDIKYKFSKKNYIDSVNKVTGLKQKQDVANKFFDGLQKDIQNELNKNFTDDEIKVIYDEAKKRSGEKQIGYPELKKLFDNKKPVIYLLKGKSIDDWNNLSNKQKRNYNERPASSIVGTSVISLIDDKNQNDSVVFKLSDGSETKKSYSQIIGPLGGDNVDKAKAILGEIKDDNDKMGNIVKFAQFLKTNTDDSKISEIDKIISKA